MKEHSFDAETPVSLSLQRTLQWGCESTACKLALGVGQDE